MANNTPVSQQFSEVPLDSGQYHPGGDPHFHLYVYLRYDVCEGFFRVSKLDREYEEADLLIKKQKFAYADLQQKGLTTNGKSIIIDDAEMMGMLKKSTES